MRLPALILSVASACLPLGAAAQSNLPLAPTSADFMQVTPEWVSLGRKLFFDPILAGNDNIACATCHHPTRGTGDAMSLSIGEGGTGLGATRVAASDNMPHERIPRNAPALWNLGAHEFSAMLHDGRVQADSAAKYGIRMPEGRELERPVVSPLAAQHTLPLLSAAEMAGQPGENPIADAIEAGKIQGPGGAWDLIAKELEVIPSYRASFDWLIGPQEEIHISDIARALANFITFEFRSTDSPFDDHLRGVPGAMTEAQTRGMELFYAKAQCSTCHSGKFQSDQKFYSIGVPQFGPGKGAGAYGVADHGRGMATGNTDDNYRFRVPTLRNIALTAPYGHNGAYGTLEGIVRHHLDPFEGLGNYDRSQAKLHEVDGLKDDWVAMDDLAEMMRIATSVEIETVALSDAEFDDLIAFLHALTDPIAAMGRLGVPSYVPSGLPIDKSDIKLESLVQTSASQ